MTLLISTLRSLRKQKLAGKGVAKESKSRAQHGCKAGGKVLRAKPSILQKMEAPRPGPFEVKQAHASGTLAVGRGAATGRASARDASPLFGWQRCAWKRVQQKGPSWGHAPLAPLFMLPPKLAPLFGLLHLVKIQHHRPCSTLLGSQYVHQS